MSPASFVIFLNGGYGVGKSATLDHVGDLLAERGTAFSLFDVDWFHRSWPPAAHDPENVLVEAENMAVVWNNYCAAGPRQPVVAGVIASSGDLRRYASIFALPVRSVRLTASARVIEDRLRRRYTQHQARSLHWHLERSAELTERQARADLDEFVIATDEHGPRSVAEQALTRVGLL